jgi:hypothetical protein
MTHREFLVWLKSQLDNAAGTGLTPDGVRAIRDQLGQMREAGGLQPFSSRLLALVSEPTGLDAATVAGLVGEVRSELAPAREKTVAMAAVPDQHDKTRG